MSIYKGQEKVLNSITPIEEEKVKEAVKANIVTAFSDTPSDEKVPSEKAVKTELDKQKISNNFSGSESIASGTTLDKDGLLIISLDTSVQNWAYAEIRINGFIVYKAQNKNGVMENLTFTMRVNKGDVISWGNANNGVTKVTLIY